MPLQLVIPLFPKFTALDGIGPYEVLQRTPDIEVTFIGHQVGPIRSDNGMLAIEADGTFEDFPTPDLIVFPGGAGTHPLMTDARVLQWVQSAHQNTTFTTSVCTGSLVLAAAGLLDGLTATTHWATRDTLTTYGSTPVSERVVEHLDQRIITAAGVSSGIDMALRLMELLFGKVAAEASQLMIEYDPQPPFDSGAIEKANDEAIAQAFEWFGQRN